MTWVKICGTTNLEDAQLSVAAGANALGFVFAPGSRRINVANAAAIVAELRGGIEAIGVFVNESPAHVAAIAGQAGLTGVQLHGEEPPASLPEFRQALGERKIIKTLRGNEISKAGGFTLDAYLSAADSIDAVLLDSGSLLQRGGTGVTFDWQQTKPLAQEIRCAMPLILAGGLNAANVAEAIAWFEPWGIDVATGVESSPGKKDENKLREFVAVVRHTAASVRQRE